MVLDDGRLKEFDAPEVLLADDDSMLSTLIRNTARAAQALEAGSKLSTLEEESTVDEPEAKDEQ